MVRHLLGQSLPVRTASRHPERVPSPSGGSRASIHTRRHQRRSRGCGSRRRRLWRGECRQPLSRTRNRDISCPDVKAAERLARQAQRAGVERLVHVSGIGADAASGSPYIRSRGEGELAVQAAFANAIIVRPAAMFGQDDAFLNTLVTLLKWFPAYPMFGRGLTRLQPVSVEDVAEAIGRCLQPAAANPVTYELGGPRVYTYEELLKAITDRLGRRPTLFSVPFPIWRSLARIAEMLPGSPLSRSQVDLMEGRHCRLFGMPGLAALAIVPQPIEPALEQICNGLGAASPRPFGYVRAWSAHLLAAPGLLRRRYRQHGP